MEVALCLCPLFYFLWIEWFPWLSLPVYQLLLLLESNWPAFQLIKYIYTFSNPEVLFPGSDEVIQAKISATYCPIIIASLRNTSAKTIAGLLNSYSNCLQTTRQVGFFGLMLDRFHCKILYNCKIVVVFVYKSAVCILAKRHSECDKYF